MRRLRRKWTWKQDRGLRALMLSCFLMRGAWGESPEGGVDSKPIFENVQESLDLREQVRTLTRLLEVSRKEVEDFRRLENSGADSAGEEAVFLSRRSVARAARVVAVDPAGRWVAVDAGSAVGIRPGLVFHVFRDDRWIAKVRVEEARERIAGAVIEKVTKGDAPVPGDRVALARDK